MIIRWGFVSPPPQGSRHSRRRTRPPAPRGGVLLGQYCSGGECGVKRDYRGKSLAQYIIDIHSNLVFDWDKYFVVNAQPNAFAKYIMYFSNPIKLNTEGELTVNSINALATGGINNAAAYTPERRASYWNENARRKWYIPANGLFAWKVPLLWKMFGEQNSIPDPQTPAGSTILTATYDRSLPRGLAPSEGLSFVPWTAATTAGGVTQGSWLKLGEIWPESSARRRDAQDGRQGPAGGAARVGTQAGTFIHELTAVDAQGINWDTCEPTTVMIKLGKLLTKDNGLGFWSPEPYIWSKDAWNMFFDGPAADAVGNNGAPQRRPAAAGAGEAAGWAPIFWNTLGPAYGGLTLAQVMRRSFDWLADGARAQAINRIFQLIYVIQLFYKKNNTPAAIGRCVDRIIPTLEPVNQRVC